jgi:tRNA pseudouridine55 synthase
MAETGRKDLSPSAVQTPRAEIDGIILYDKPAGITSFDVVAKVRRAFPKKTKVGHAGTLDPFATGLLIVLVGRATKIQRFVMELPKRYTVTARLGWKSTTGDPEGEITKGKRPSERLNMPTGTVRQKPPAFSAVKIKGQRAYKLARKGEEFEMPERQVEVYRFDQIARREVDGVEEASFLIECSAGTYVRSLIADFDDAYCTELRRERIGRFDVADADPERIISLAEISDLVP